MGKFVEETDQTHLKIIIIENNVVIVYNLKLDMF
jgi:hypothetical protein